MNSIPIFHQEKIPDEDNYDLDSSWSNSFISNNDKLSKQGLKLKLKWGLKNYVIPDTKVKPNPQNLLKSKLFAKTLENVVGQKLTSYKTHFMSQLKLDQAHHNSIWRFERRMSFSNALRDSSKSKSKRLSLNSKKYSWNENTTGWSTRASTIFGKKELNLIYQNNSLEWLPEGDSICTEDSVLKPSKARLDINDGLNKLQKLFNRKNFCLKIQALYKLLSNNSWNTNDILSWTPDRPRKGEVEIYRNAPLTTKRHTRKKKSFAFGFQGIENEQEEKSLKYSNIHHILRSEVSKEDRDMDLNSEQDYALRTIKCSTTSEFGKFEEEEEIYLCSELNDSFELQNKQDSFSLEIGHLLENNEKDSIGEELKEFEISSVDENEIGNKASRFSSLGSEDPANELAFKNKILMNNKDMDQMAKELEKIREMLQKENKI